MYDVAIVGAGIVGLATGRELLLRYPHLRLSVLDKEAAIGQHQTGHNSGVIHSGIYYAPASLKATLCIAGRRALYAYCDAKGIQYRQPGKMIVATKVGELPRLHALWERGHANKIEGLQSLDGAEIREREPHCTGIKAIFIPTTGIVDYAAVAQSLAADIREMQGEILTSRGVTAIVRTAQGMTLQTNSGDLHARAVITCAGLQADRLAKMTGENGGPKIVPFRGDYLLLKPHKRYLVTTNIYPVPDPSFPFLGAHFTPRINGEVWLGPNAVLAFAREGYRFKAIDVPDLFESLTYPGLMKLAFTYPGIAVREMYRDVVRSAYVNSLRRYIPELKTADTLPGPSGVRAQAMRADGTLVDDFVIEGSERVMHVRNAPSPAATASLAIGAYIADQAEIRFSLART